MARGLLQQLISVSLSVSGKWQKQQLRYLNNHECEVAKLTSICGINFPNYVAVSSVEEVKEAIQGAFPKENELVIKSQILAGGRGLGTFKGGLKGGMHAVRVEEVQDIDGASAKHMFPSHRKCLGIMFDFVKMKGNFCHPYAATFSSSIHSVSRKESEVRRNSMNFVRGVAENDGLPTDSRVNKDIIFGGSPRSRYAAEGNTNADFVQEPLSRYAAEGNTNADFVHIKMIHNNTFVTITDSKGNKKAGASSGCLAEMKGGPKVSRYAAEATAEHVGRLARNLGLKSVVMKVKGFTYFKKKRQAIMSWKEGYSYSRGDRNPILYIEDTTRLPHNGCRLRKRRRV